MMSPRRRILSLGFWAVVAVIAILWSKGVYDDAIANPVCDAAPCSAADAEARAPVVAGGQFLIVILGGVVLYGLGKLTVHLFSQARRPK